MIRIKLDLDLSHSQSWPIMRSKVMHKLKSKGLRFVDSNPDILLIHQTKFNKSHLDLNIPIILLERIDSSSVTKRKEIKHPNIIGVIKNTVFRDAALNNAPVQYGRYHAMNIIKSEPKLKVDSSLQFYDQSIKLDNNDLNKLELGWTFALYQKMQNYINIDFDCKAKRSIDAFFVGTTDYGKNTVAINHHRKKCIIELNKLKRLNIVAGSGRPKSKKQYDELMLSSKICVSPWGLGEACYRDFESIYSGSILIKPDTSYIQGYQDIYQNDKYYIPCKIDFSDLGEKILWVRNNWNDLHDFRINARQYLLDAWDIDKFSDHIYNIITNCMKRIEK